MKIDVIYIPCYRRDFRLTRILVANIRHWYPEIPIVLIKDLLMRDFDTTELEKNFNVSVYPQKARLYGWGFSKFEVFFDDERKRFLMLDSDIVLCGPLLEMLSEYNEDWIVHDEPFTIEDMHRYYFNPDNIKKLDPEFEFQNFTFNTGQFAGFTGSLKREEFDRFIEWKEPRVQMYRDAFTFGGEQPLLNYLLMKKMSKKEITLRRLNFMRESLHADTAKVEVQKIMNKEGYPFIIHWHDKKPNLFHPDMPEIPRRDILLHFEKIYYRKCGVGPAKQFFRMWYEHIEDWIFLKLVLSIGQISFLRKLRKLLKG
jgi:hypothetical protein